MARIQINTDKMNAEDKGTIFSLCPFGAIEERNGVFSITPACRMCMLCVKNGPEGMFILVEKEESGPDLSAWKDIFIVAEVSNGAIHPVTLELIGKARELADKVSHKVSVVIIRSEIEGPIEWVRRYGVDRIIAYQSPSLQHFLIEPYTAILERIVKEEKPGIMLFGGTIIGRILAPRLAARVRTGLTADCTCLDIQDNTDLDQIRPAFGGNIMAHIRTTRHRPQIATVRYKIFDRPPERVNPSCRLEYRTVDADMIHSRVSVIEERMKSRDVNIEEADTIVAVGNGLCRKEDLSVVRTVAELLGASIAGSRPVIEKGWIDPRSQIGLSGRTVRPKLIITCGISGSIQFAAGMQGAETIIAINKDESVLQYLR